MKNIIYVLLILTVSLSNCKKRENIGDNNIINTEELITIEEISPLVSNVDTLLEINRKMYVNALEGLRVRNSPGLDGDRIALLDFKTEVVAKIEDENSVIIDGIEGKWTFIEFNDIKGWVFGGYLSLSYLEYRIMDGTIGIIAAHIANDLLLFDYNRNKDRNDLKSFLGSHNVFDYKIIKEWTSKSIHDDGINTYWTIETGSYTTLIVSDFGLWSILGFEIEISESNYRHLFPYNTMDEYINDVNFGKRDMDMQSYNPQHSECIYYEDTGLNSWWLEFNNGLLYKIGFSLFVP